MLYGCQFEEPGSVDVLSSAEDGRQAGVRRAGHPRQMSRHSDTIARQN